MILKKGFLWILQGMVFALPYVTMNTSIWVKLLLIFLCSMVYLRIGLGCTFLTIEIIAWILGFLTAIKTPTEITSKIYFVAFALKLFWNLGIPLIITISKAITDKK